MLGLFVWADWQGTVLIGDDLLATVSGPTLVQPNIVPMRPSG
uniref:Uncharacterized protein n=1 Tax=Picea glauca TaxID=3330 RepID=A0A101M091_PICGL|nr:hypothetical protein ABT39_MTgene4579 [Picea glauca]